jgi:hypothetical protein
MTMTRTSLHSDIVAWRLKTPGGRPEHTVNDARGGSGCPSDSGTRIAGCRLKGFGDELALERSSYPTAKNVDNELS